MERTETHQKHKTLWLAVIWLAFLVVALGLQAYVPTELPLDVLVNVTGWVCLAYVGVSKSANIMQAVHAPAGDFGFEYTPGARDKILWVTIAWLFVVAEVLVVRAIMIDPIPLPVAEIIGYAGTLSAIYVGLDKGAKVAAASGTKPPEAA